MARVFRSNVRELSGRRFDPDFVWFSRRQSNFRFPAKALGSLLAAPPEYGAAEPGVVRESGSQIRYVRITDIDEHGELLQTLGATVEHVEPQYLLADNDLLFARSGNTVGKCYLHDSSRVEYPCLYAGYMIRFRFDDSVLPRFVFAFAQTPYYRDWVSAVRRAAGQPNINAQEYSDLRIPLPPLAIQRKIVAELDAAYAAKRSADEKAAKLFASIDDMVLDELGIAKLPPRDTSLAARVFTVPLKEVANGRVDAYSYHPYFARNQARIHVAENRQLGDVVCLSHEQWGQDKWGCGEEKTFPYIEIGAVSVVEGEVSDIEEVEIADAPSRARMLVREGDLLVSLTRPTRRAIAFATGDAVASTGFAVIRGFSDDVVPEYVLAILRSEMCMLQFDQRSTGGNYPAITEDQLLRTEIPVPPKPVQERIVRRASAIKLEAKRLKSSAAAQLAAAKKRIESELIETGRS